MRFTAGHAIATAAFAVVAAAIWASPLSAVVTIGAISVLGTTIAVQWLTANPLRVVTARDDTPHRPPR